MLNDNQIKLAEENSEFTKKKIKLEAQVVKTLKYASMKEEETRHASVQLVETYNDLRSLDNGKKQLDHLLNIRKGDQYILDSKENI